MVWTEERCAPARARADLLGLDALAPDAEHGRHDQSSHRQGAAHGRAMTDRGPAPPRWFLDRRPGGAATVLYVVYALTVAGVTLVQAAKRWPNNFLIFRAAARHLWAGRDLYAPAPGVHYDLFKYSPAFAALFTPFALVPVWLGLLAWNGAVTAAFVYAVGRLYPLARDRAIALAIVWWAFFFAVRGAQTNALVAALMILAVLAIDRAQPHRTAVMVVLGALIKLFPLATLPLALLRHRLGRTLLWCAAYAGIALVLPLVILSPAALRAEYASWYRVEQIDALSRGYSVMGLVHDWFAVTLPPWAIQLAGTLVLVTPVLLRWRIQRRTGASGPSPRFVRLWLASVLMYVVLFNHQAEFQSYVIAAAGLAVWFMESPRRWPWILWTAVGALGLHPFPYVLTWGVLQVQLLGEARSAGGRPGRCAGRQGRRGPGFPGFRAWPGGILGGLPGLTGLPALPGTPGGGPLPGRASWPAPPALPGRRVAASA